MDWKKALRHPLREYNTWVEGQVRRLQVPPDWLAIENEQADPQPDSETDVALDIDRVCADREAAERAEIAGMAARAAERAQEKRRRFPPQPVRPRKAPRVSPDALGGAEPGSRFLDDAEQLDRQYDRFRYTEWEQRNAERVALMSPEERQERFRSEEMLTRYRAGLPARDDDEREAYREWQELDAEYVEDYVEEVLIPEREYENYEGPLSWYEYLAQYRAERRDDAATNDDTTPPSTGPSNGPEGGVAEPAQSLPGAAVRPGSRRSWPACRGCRLII